VIFDVDIDREKWHLNTLAFLHLVTSCKYSLLTPAVN
jgi:hypothetical protein